MPIYNLYFMNSRGHIDRIKHVEAVSDDAVIGPARQEEGRQAIEIWSEHRKVHRIEAINDGEMHLRHALQQSDRGLDGVSALRIRPTLGTPQKVAAE